MNPELLASPPSEEEMNLIDLPPLTKRQRVQYLPKETPEQCREQEEMVRELGIEPMGAGSPCERCANFSILCLPVTNFIWPYLHQFSIDSHGLNGYGKPLKRPFDWYQSRLEAISNGRDIRQINW